MTTLNVPTQPPLADWQPYSPTIESEWPNGQPTLDVVKMQVFVQKVMADLSGAVACIVGALGDRLGIFNELVCNGAATSAELSERTGLCERYIREWLAAMAAAGYLAYDPLSQRFTLPPEHAAVLAQEGGVLFMGGAYQQLIGLTQPLDLLRGAFSSGEGIPQTAYGDNLLDGMERMSATWLDNLFVQQWLPLIPEVLAKLKHGARVADIGCGSGRALIKLAQAFPHSTFVGYDAFQPAVTRARANAESAGVANRVHFEQRDILSGLPGHYDLIATFDSAHDFADLYTGLKIIRQALYDNGTYLMLEMNSADALQDNIGPIGTVLYGTSLLYNLPVSLANGGQGLGTMGLPEMHVRSLCADVGFTSVQRLPIQNPFNVLYEIKP